MGVNVGVGESIGKGVNDGIGVALLTGSEGVSEGRVVVFLFRRAQLETNAIKSIKLNDKAMYCLFIGSSESSTPRITEPNHS